MGNCSSYCTGSGQEVDRKMPPVQQGRREPPPSTIERYRSFANSENFTYQQLRDATSGFRDRIGGGGSGEVFRGELPASPQMGRQAPLPIAVKRLVAANPASEERRRREFEEELKNFGRLSHKNLVGLLGWCYEHETRDGDLHHRLQIVLVYEFVANNDLHHLLHEQKDREACLWPRRFRIVCDLAEALLYLHRGTAQRTYILHRDIKPSNIMLDHEYNAKLGDFGLARKLERSASCLETRTLSGTPYYMAPELSLGPPQFTMETDMYSFGVVLLEVASGRKPNESVYIPNAPRRLHNSNQPLVQSVWYLSDEGRLLEAADERLHMMYVESEMRRVLTVGLACCNQNPRARLNIKEAEAILSGSIDQLPIIPRWHDGPAGGVPSWWESYETANTTAPFTVRT